MCMDRAPMRRDRSTLFIFAILDQRQEHPSKPRGRPKRDIADGQFGVGGLREKAFSQLLTERW